MISWHCIAVSAIYMVKKCNLLFLMIISFTYDLYMEHLFATVRQVKSALRLSENWVITSVIIFISSK